MASMNFWGIEVKGKEPNSVEVEGGQVIHVSQATLGEAKKDNEHVTIHVKVGDKKLVMGMLSQNNPQLSFDLVFDEDFEISHNWKNGTIHFLGYHSEMLDDASTEEFSDSSDEDVPTLVPIRENGKPAAVAPAATKAAAKPNKDNNPKLEEKVEEEDDESDDEDGSDDDDDDEDDVDMLGGSDEEEGSDDDDDDVEGSSDEEETPKMVLVGKKRSKTDAKTPEPKKAKLATPQKTDGKKAHPSKKTPGADKSTPKTNAHVSYGSSKKTFNSGKALGSHLKAKHGRK